jgi:HD-GYP domain-containing protein (c-di-GMP phosphodiesterase class II)
MARDRSIHRMLALRIAAATLAVAALAAGVAALRERGRTEELATERAQQGAALIRLALADELDTGLADRAAVQRKLDRLRGASAGAQSGRFVSVVIRDAAGGEVARVEAPSSAPAPGAPLVSIAVPLQDSAGRVAATVAASFEPSGEAIAEARRRLAGTLALAIGFVLGTAALLYPVVARLLARLESLSRSLLDANLETLSLMGSAIAKRDSDTDAHNYRVTVYAVRVGEAMELDDDALRSLVKGAFLHDVGKLGIRDAILLKPGRLDAAEFAEMKQHVRHGLDIVTRSPWLRDAVAVVGHHHEKWDGSGYGEGLRGEAIPLPARIFAVADVFDALTSRRPYKDPLPVAEALAILEQGRGTHFDPGVLDRFAPLAAELHACFAGEDGVARRAVAALTERYFRTDLSALLPGDTAEAG